MTPENLTDVYSLFVEGLIIGGLFSVFPFAIGQIINLIFKSVKSA